MAVIRKYNLENPFYQAVTTATTKIAILMTDMG